MKFDFIIIGGGTSGHLIANKLSRKYHVALVEKGLDHNFLDKFLINFPIGSFVNLHRKKITKNYICEPSKYLKHRELKWPRGETLGGSSSINGLVYKRGEEDDFKNLYEKELIDIEWKKIQELYCENERELGIKVNDNYQNSLRDKNIIVEKFLESCEKNSFKKLNSFIENSNFISSCANYDLTLKNGERIYSRNIYKQKTKYLKIFTQSLVSKILIENKKAIGIEFIKNKKKIKIYCKKEIVLSAGTINSPKILQLSGIGNENFLKNFNIKINQNNDFVGKNLRDHLQTKLTYQINTRSNFNYLNKNKFGFFFFKNVLKYLITKKGMFASGPIQAGAFPGKNHGYTKYNFQLNLLLGSGSSIKSVDNFSGITLSVNTLNPDSNGFVNIKSTNPSIDPIIQPNYFEKLTDLEKHLSGIELIRNISKTKPLSDMIIKEIIPGEKISSKEELIDFIKDTSETIYHPSGTCKLGKINEGVVDHDFKVHGIKNLRICDASILPNSISGNLGATCYLLGLILSKKLNEYS